MRPTSLQFIRRILIWVIVGVAASVLANYVYTRYLQDRDELKDLPVLSSETVQSARRIEYSDNRGGMPRFKIVAQQLVETRQGKNFLQGIEAFDLNPDGSTRNKIQSRNALYDNENKTIDFIGDVLMSLGKSVELRTDSLHYDLNANVGTTEDPVQFNSESVKGEARGLRYNLDTRELQLGGRVDLVMALQEKASAGRAAPQEYYAVSDRAKTHENLKRVELLGNARLESDTFALVGDAVRALTDADGKKMESLSAEGHARYQSRDSENSRTMAGDRIDFKLNPENQSPENISVSGRASLDFASGSEAEHLRAEEIELHLDPEHGVPSSVDGRTGVQLEMQRGPERFLVSGGSFHALFDPETQGLQRMDVRQQAGISMTGAADAEANEIRAERIEVQFSLSSGRSVLKTLHAENSASWTARTPNSAGAATPATSGTLAASVIDMYYSAKDGSLDRVEASRDVVMTKMPSGKAGDRAPVTVTAEKIRFRFYSGRNRPKDMSAEGNVQVVQQGEPGTGAAQASGGFHTWSDRMQASFAPDTEDIVLVSGSQWGHFKYRDASSSATSGRCDFDARKEIITLNYSPEIFFDLGSATGESVEFDQKRGVVVVRGNVRSVLSGKKKAGFFGNLSENPHSIILADSMEYHTETGDIRYAQNVNLLSEEQQLQADAVKISGNGSRIEADGKVLHRILRRRVSAAGRNTNAGSPASGSKAGRTSAVEPLTIRSSKLEYLKSTNTITYSGGVSLHSADLQLKSGNLEAVLDDEGKEVEKATATKDVVVFKGNWECRGEVAYYFASPEKFVVTGAPVELLEPDGIRSYPHRLTYNVADDRIQLERRQD